jgi:hypothetical protein
MIALDLVFMFSSTGPYCLVPFSFEQLPELKVRTVALHGLILKHEY